MSVRGYSKDGNKKYYSIPSKIKKVNVFLPAMVSGVQVTGRTDSSITCKWMSEKFVRMVMWFMCRTVEPEKISNV